MTLPTSPLLPDPHGLLSTGDALDQGITRRTLDALVRAGTLVRLRRGVYVDGVVWQGSDPRERHLTRMRAATRAARHPLVFGADSAAAAWGVPIDGYPDHVVVVDLWRGGGRSEPGVVRTARAASTIAPVLVGDVVCTSLERTVIDLVRGAPLAVAIPLLDWAMSERCPTPVDRSTLAHEAKEARCGTTTLRAIVLASGDSGSIGESRARVAIRALGFPAPQLQTRFVDAQGEMFVDFFWPDADVVAEFDGKVKYTREEYTHGDPAEVVWREKLREDRLRRLARAVVRLTSADIHDSARLVAILKGAGLVPGRRGGSSSRPAGATTRANRAQLPPPRVRNGAVDRGGRRMRR